MPKNKEFRRNQFTILHSRLLGKRQFIQVLAGPRQTGKTTISQQVARLLKCPILYISADEPLLRGTAWIEQQWETARLKAKQAKPQAAVLILDEIQKIPGWSETVKRLWDADTINNISLKVVLLGSAPLLIHKGLTESLAGRFEIIPVTHWSFTEMKEAFDWTVDKYIYYGGYPGSADLISDRHRWASYIIDSLIETTISRDILLMRRVDKPALLRQLFHIGCSYSGQIVSYQKLLGQLQDAGNTTTLAHYLQLLEAAGMLAGLQKYSVKQFRMRSSSPKLIVLNNALMAAQSDLSLKETKDRPDLWGRLVESTVGAHLMKLSLEKNLRLFYWREGDKEVDFILQRGKIIMAIEVKSGRKREALEGVEAFRKHFKPHRTILIGAEGIPLKDFLESDIEHWLT